MSFIEADAKEHIDQEIELIKSLRRKASAAQQAWNIDEPVRSKKEPAPVPMKLVPKEEKLEMLKEARDIVARLEKETGMDLELFTMPDWKAPVSWEMMQAKELSPGDGVIVKDIICIVVKRLAWWRSKTADILVHEVHNSQKYYRIGSIDFVKGYKGYVHSQKMSTYGMDSLS